MAQFVLQPDWLQHVSDELQLNTQTHTLVIWRGDAPLHSNETFSLTCSLRQKPGNFAHCASCPKDLKKETLQFSGISIRKNVNSLTSFFFYFHRFPFSFPLKYNPVHHTLQHTHTQPHHFTTHLSLYRIIQLHLTHLKRARCMLEHAYSFFSTNDHSPNSCKITGRWSAHSHPAHQWEALRQPSSHMHPNTPQTSTIQSSCDLSGNFN